MGGLWLFSYVEQLVHVCGIQSYTALREGKGKENEERSTIVYRMLNCCIVDDRFLFSRFEKQKGGRMVVEYYIYGFQLLI